MLHTHIMTTATLLITFEYAMDGKILCMCHTVRYDGGGKCMYADAPAKSLSERCDSLNSRSFTYLPMAPHRSHHAGLLTTSFIYGTPAWTGVVILEWQIAPCHFTHSWYLECQVPRLSSPSVRVTTEWLDDFRRRDDVFSWLILVASEGSSGEQFLATREKRTRRKPGCIVWAHTRVIANNIIDHVLRDIPRLFFFLKIIQLTKKK